MRCTGQSLCCGDASIAHPWLVPVPSPHMRTTGLTREPRSNLFVSILGTASERASIPALLNLFGLSPGFSRESRSHTRQREARCGALDRVLPQPPAREPGVCAHHRSRARAHLTPAREGGNPRHAQVALPAGTCWLPPRHEDPGRGPAQERQWRRSAGRRAPRRELQTPREVSRQASL